MQATYNSWLVALSIAVAVLVSYIALSLAARAAAAKARLTRQEALLVATSRMGEIGGWELERDAAGPYWSDMVYRIHDLPVGQMPELSKALDFYPPGARDIVSAAVSEAFEHGKAFDLVSPFLTAKGRHRWVRSIGEPQLHQGRCTRIVGAFQDVTESRQVHETLRIARDTAEAANRAKSEFLANMSHEIRTPLNGVIGMTGLMLDTPLNAQQREYAEIVRSSGESLLALINDILDFSKIEAGRLELESIEFNLHDVIEDTIDAVALRAAEKELELVVDMDARTPHLFRGDPTRLRQILLNLLSNAVKFTQHGEVGLGLTTTSAGDSHLELHFAVRDTGIGISADRVEALFAPFTQADSSTTRKFGGSGLGLSISKHLAEAMGGIIEVDSTVGEGSTFRFAIRLPKVAVADRTHAAGRLDGLEVLVVAEHAGSRRSLERQLSPEGCRLTLAASAKEGFAAYLAMLANDKPPAAVLMDHPRPQNGAWLATAIRAADAPPPSLILLSSLTASVPGDAVCLMDRIMTKPVKTSVLVRTLVELARSDKPAPEHAQPTVTTQTFSGLRVLLAEDNAVNQKLATRLLQQLGADVRVAANGHEALHALSESDFDVVLMDCQMPQMDGYEATRQLRHAPGRVRNPQIPVIALTAHALATDRAKCLAAGMNDYLTKPVDPARLQQALTKATLTVERRGAPHCVLATLFDEAAFVVRTGHDLDFARELIALFVTSASETLAQINTASSSDDPAPVRRLAHSLKGAAGTVAAVAVSAAAATLEKAQGAAQVQAALRATLTAFDDTVAAWARGQWIPPSAAAAAAGTGQGR